MCRGTRGSSGLPCRDLAAGAWDGGGWGAWIPALPCPASSPRPPPSTPPANFSAARRTFPQRGSVGGERVGVWPHLYPGVGLVPYPPPPRPGPSEDVGYTGQTEQMDKLEKSRCEGFNLGFASKKSCPPCPALRGLSLNKLEVPHPGCPFHPSRERPNRLPEKFQSLSGTQKKNVLLAIQPNPLLAKVVARPVRGLDLPVQGRLPGSNLGAPP